METKLRNSLTRYLSVFLVLISLFAFNSAKALHPTIPGYTFMGVYNGHYYYISNLGSGTTGTFRGVDIAGAVTSAIASATPAVGGIVPSAATLYAVTLSDLAENTAVQNFVLANNITTFGGTGKAPGAEWANIRNPWIGFNDDASEGNFVWANGEPVCFTNWNVGEPNDFLGAEDFTQMLIMENYSTVNPLGKWNDWFDVAIPPNTETRLRLVLEVGVKPVSCGRGNYGCSHGYWKNASTASWDGTGGPGLGTQYHRSDVISTIFGITNDRGVITLGVTTLDQGLSLKGGGYNQVLKQGIAALLNAAYGYFPYTEAEVVAAVKSSFNTGTANLPAVTVEGVNYPGLTNADPGALATYLDNLNSKSRRGCPLNHHGDLTLGGSQSSGTESDSAIPDLLTADKKFSISAYPIPSNTAFSIQIDGSTAENVSYRVIDMSGKLIEQRTNLQANQKIKVGDNYRPGLYFIEVIQGDSKKQLKLVKQ